MSDAELIERIRDGDRSAWDELVDQHSPFLWRLARSIVNDDAAASDAMQTAWLRLLQHVDRINDPSAVRGWLATTTRREAIALSKSMQRLGSAEPGSWSLDRPTEPVDDPGELTASNQQHATVLTALRGLSEKCQQLLTMHAHKVAYDVIAEVMELAIGSIGPTKARCLEQLRRSPAIMRLEGV